MLCTQGVLIVLIFLTAFCQQQSNETCNALDGIIANRNTDYLITCMKNTLCTVVTCNLFQLNTNLSAVVTLLPCAEPTGIKVVITAPLLNSMTLLNETITENRNVPLLEAFSSSVIMINLTQKATGINFGVSN